MCNQLMDEERHNPRIRRVKLDQIMPEEVVAFLMAYPGAMGDSGAVEFYSIHDDLVLYFYGNAYFGDLDLNEVSKHLPDGLRYDKGFWFHFDETKWALFGGGMGNEFLIRSQYYPEFQRHYQDCVFERRYYRNCVIPLEELLLEIASGGGISGL